MPILRKFDTVSLTKPQFYEIDHLVMKHAFAIQNELGRLYDEQIYHEELSRRCISSGLKVLSEGEITVSLDSFSKSYYFDALINGGLLYEFKAVESLNGQHESQLLNYLLLSDLRFGKLVNFSSPSVQYRFVTTTLNITDRMNYKVDESMRIPNRSIGDPIRDIIYRLLAEWGAFLDINLYREAIFHFLGGKDFLMHPVNITVGDQIVGSQKLSCLDRETCLHISSTVRHVESYRKQLLKILEFTNLKQIEWVNFNRSTVQLLTLKK